MRTVSGIQVASSEVVRDINRRVVLNLIRTKQPISRADLARVSGLQRSTISLIVEELIAKQWVLEGPTGRLPRGRRPTFLRLNDERVIIGVDIRPTQITVALSDVNGKFASQEAMATPATPRIAMENIVARVQRLLRSCAGKKMVEGIGISVPGRVDPGSERLVFAPNLHWPDFDLRVPVEKATGCEVELENAANACVLAAVWFDHMDCRNMVVVTVSEGIGTGVLANGHVVRGFSGMAGEFGHVPLDLKGPQCTCGSRGCWEVFGSNRAALRYYFESGANAGTAGGLNFLDLLRLADQGDARAAQALETMAHYLGRGMRMIVAGLDPEQIVVIGDLTRAWNRFGPVIQAEVQAQVLPGGVAPRLLPVHEDGMARLRGTVALVLQKHFGVNREVPA
ncbi:MAG TPA: ROK family protein [Bryobacteraceae bacterium]|nr:ROK family protein [Bryobacteraceae bacterium]